MVAYHSPMTETEAPVSRYHALDSLRAAMMFLGIYLHAVVFYSPNGGWPFRPPQTTTALDYTMTLIHLFRMPVFYVMAGFFTALLWQRYGLRRAAINRFWRIVVPFVAGSIIVFPLTMFLVSQLHRGWPRSLDFILSGRFLAYAHPLHLWFLEYLIVLYLLAIVAVVAIRTVVPAPLQARLLGWFRSIVQSVWAPAPFVALSFLAMLAMRHAWIEDPSSAFPVVRLVAVYAIPFAFGWLLFAQADLLEMLGSRAWLYSALGGAAAVAYLVLLYSCPDRGAAFVALRAVHALAMWGAILGITGLFVRYLSGHSALRRYLCDSSYFLYIVHLPTIVAFQVVLKDVPLPVLAKVAIVLIATIVVLLPVYRYTVRPTFIGAVLNGRRYPGALSPAVRAS